jgi:hypothetical protein
MDEGEVRTAVPVEKIHEAQLWREATMASPLPLGLAGFAIAAFTSGLALALGVPILGTLPILVVFGGITLWTMALFALRKGSTFAATFFGIVGSFNIVWAIYTLYAARFALPGQVAALAPGLGVYVFLVAFVIAYLMLCAFQVSRALSGVLLTLFVSYLALGLGMVTAAPGWLTVAGWLAVISAIIAFYASFAIIFNSVAHKEHLPLVSTRREEAEVRA